MSKLETLNEKLHLLEKPINTIQTEENTILKLRVLYLIYQTDKDIKSIDNKIESHKQITINFSQKFCNLNIQSFDEIVLYTNNGYNLDLDRAQKYKDLIEMIKLNTNLKFYPYNILILQVEPISICHEVSELR